MSDTPNLEHDKLIGQIEARMREEHARQSDASESAAKVKEFIEETQMNTQAFSWCKSILKKLPKKDGAQKAMDIIRSLEAGLPLIKDHVQGQQRDMLEENAPEVAEAPKKKKPAARKKKAEAKEAEPAEDTIDDDAAAFEHNLADLEEDDGKVAAFR